MHKGYGSCVYVCVCVCVCQGMAECGSHHTNQNNIVKISFEFVN